MEILLDYIFPVLLSAIGTVIALQFKGMRSDIKDLNGTVRELIVEVATVVRDVSWHKEEINEIKTRVCTLEKQNRR